MKIERLRVNRLENPVGYDLMKPTVSYVVRDAKGRRQTSARITVASDEAFKDVVFDSGDREDIVSTAFELPFETKSETRYYWKVSVKDDANDSAESDTAYFETAKGDAWDADWISVKGDNKVQAVMYKEIEVKKPVKKARIYMTGLGLYELNVNGEKQGDERLLPGFFVYDSYLQYQTFDVSFKEGKNLIEVLMGDGWYKGNYGLVKRYENYGDRLALIAEIKLFYEDGTTEKILTDTSWRARSSNIIESGIYSGEVIDMTADVTKQYETEVIDIDKSLLTPRLSPAIKVINKIKPVELIHTPAGESVLDMGQNMVGMLAFNAHAKKGTKIYLQFGEILQDGNFYRDNLRTAKAEFTYISDGEDRRVRQHFTFYGFRFVKVTGWEGEIDLNDFEGEVIHSEMEELGSITTSDELVNRLVLNAKWGMKGNFVDVPTDCPQRDERYGWTGDAQIFSGTACFFMDTYAFYTKYGKDLYEEQKKMGGSVPDVVPVANYPGGASTAWADAATIIPWNVYLHYGDRGILVRQYESMKGWVDFMKREDDADGGKGLWNTGSHYADWLALDGNYPGGVFGETDPNMIASGYYYYSTKIVATAAKIIGKDEDAAFYEAHAKKIYDAFVKEYFSQSGRLAVDTMTAYVIVLYFGLTPEDYKERVRRGLLRKLQRNRYHLETGFVGTPYLCRVLSENGMNDLAYHLLMEKGYPGWLYEVIMGATTIWERWNSVEPDGKISGTAMNSLNHYSYGSIVEWMFRNMLGINPDKEKGGFKAFTIKPLPDHHISSAEARFDSAAGLIRSSWKIEGDKLKFEFEVPFDSEAVVVLPDADAGEIEKAAAGMDGISGLKQDGSSVCFKALAGTYSFEYKPTTPYRKKYSIFTPYKELLAYEPTRKILDENYHVYLREVPVPFEDELFTLEEMLNGPFTSIPKEAVEKLDRLLREVE